jgi:GH24 family phage-related lysozyme (muramidase)
MNNIVPRMMDILARWETCQLKSYLDSDGTYHVGYGSGNANASLPFVIDEHTVLKDEAEARSILLSELNNHYVPQLTTLLSKIGFTATDHEFSGLLDTGYNRGMGRLRDSLAFRFLQHPELKWFREWAAMALVFSNPVHFGSYSQAANTALEAVWRGEPVEPLDVNAKGETRLGLTLRRMDDAALFLTRA